MRFLLLLMEVLYVPGGFVRPYVEAAQSGYERFARKQKNGVPSGPAGGAFSQILRFFLILCRKTGNGKSYLQKNPNLL